MQGIVGSAAPHHRARAAPARSLLAGLMSLGTRPRWRALPNAATMLVAQEALQFHQSVEEPRKRLASRILEQQRRSSAFAGKRERPRRPGGVELVPQLIFVEEVIKAGRRRVLYGRPHGQHRAAAARAV